ncbi:MAG: hypothetical protein HOO96_35325, partial [Polyangiaceae bacterium]|nr:hypothetical protein [Polyangiaceae bacterium]
AEDDAEATDQEAIGHPEEVARPIPTVEAQNLPKPHGGGGYHPPAPRPRPQTAAAKPPKAEGPSIPQSMDPPQPPQPALSPSDILTDAL